MLSKCILGSALCTLCGFCCFPNLSLRSQLYAGSILNTKLSHLLSMLSLLDIRLNDLVNASYHHIRHWIYFFKLPFHSYLGICGKPCEDIDFSK